MEPAARPESTEATRELERLAAEQDAVRPESLVLWWQATWEKQFLLLVCTALCGMPLGLIAEVKGKGFGPFVQSLLMSTGLIPGILGVAWVGREALRYRRWREGLPFAVRGWNRLVAQEGFDTKENWWPAELEFPGASQAALARHFKVFSEAAYKAGRYPTDDRESDARRPWILEGTTARGTINCHVAFALVAWLRSLAPEARSLELTEVVLRLTGPSKHLSHDTD